MHVIASIENPVVIEKILAHLERREAASATPHARRAPPAIRSGQPDSADAIIPRSAHAVPFPGTATIAFVYGLASAGLARTSRLKHSPLRLHLIRRYDRGLRSSPILLRQGTCGILFILPVRGRRGRRVSRRLGRNSPLLAGLAGGASSDVDAACELLRIRA